MSENQIIFHLPPAPNPKDFTAWEDPELNLRYYFKALGVWERVCQSIINAFGKTNGALNRPDGQNA